MTKDVTEEREVTALRILARHPAILARMLPKSSALLGEIIVADRIERLGYRVKATNNNSRQLDLIAVSPKGVRFGLEVKTGMQKRPTWPVGKCPDLESSRIWCFVSAPRKPQELPDFDTAEVFVLTVEEAKGHWLASPYNQTARSHFDIRRHQLPNDTLNAWWKLPL